LKFFPVFDHDIKAEFLYLIVFAERFGHFYFGNAVCGLSAQWGIGNKMQSKLGLLDHNKGPGYDKVFSFIIDLQKITLLV